MIFSDIRSKYTGWMLRELSVGLALVVEKANATGWWIFGVSDSLH
jgi:hypothetical protein